MSTAFKPREWWTQLIQWEFASVAACPFAYPQGATFHGHRVFGPLAHVSFLRVGPTSSRASCWSSSRKHSVTNRCHVSSCSRGRGRSWPRQSPNPRFVSFSSWAVLQTLPWPTRHTAISQAH